MVACWSNKDETHKLEIEKLIRDYGIGGIIFMQGGPVRQANWCNDFQSKSKVKMLIGQDAEWGPAMRLDSMMWFPRQITCGAVQKDSLIFEMGKAIGEQCKRVGVNINFAPVCDINNNPMNPVIGDRSFGEEKINVTNKSLMYTKGLQAAGVLACAKHFPGHGNTGQDSHNTLPTIKASEVELDSLELVPFRKQIAEGVDAMMVAHLFIPSLDAAYGQASTLSSKIINGLLRKKLGYIGLVITDALNMKGVTNYYPSGQLEVKCIEAGNDILLFPDNIPLAVNSIRTAIGMGKISQTEIDEHVKRILHAKFNAGLNHYRSIPLKNIYADINAAKYVFIKQKILESALTLVKNQDSLLPIRNLEKKKIASVAVGEFGDNVFQQTLDLYSATEKFAIDKNATAAEFVALKSKLEPFNLILVSLHAVQRLPGNNYGLSSQEIEFINSISAFKKTVFINFGSPYALKNFSSANCILQAFTEDSIMQNLAAQAIFGGIPIRGKLPVSVGGIGSAGEGIQTGEIRMKYTMPEELGLSDHLFQDIDSVVQFAISQHAIPGCQIFASRNGKVFLNQSYGKFTYDDTSRQVSNEVLYDLASVTKIASTTCALMNLYDHNMIDLVQPLEKYLPEFTASNKQNLLLREFMTHQGGLVAWIPFYKSTLNANGFPSEKYYSKKDTGDFTIRITDDLFMKKQYVDTIWSRVISSPVKNRGTYLYSDLDFIILGKLVERISSLSLNRFVNETIYEPLGLSTMSYQPLNKFPINRIAPTTEDVLFRKERIQGYVHDPGAAMMNGVAGHAGLFSNANDLGVLMQMILQAGNYGGTEFFKKETVALFTKQQSLTCRRGLGFDKPDPHNGNVPCGDGASASTFGHQGFTGTCTWADPDNGIVFVYLSNRTYPDEQNNKLLTLGIRGEIQQMIYAAFGIH